MKNNKNMKDLQRKLIEKIVKASEYIHNINIRGIFNNSEQMSVIYKEDKKIITLDLFPKLNGKNKNGRYVDEDSFMKCMNEFIESHKKRGVTYFEFAPDPLTPSVNLDLSLSNVFGAIKKIYFDDATNSYKCDITVLGKYENLSDLINNEQYCLATITAGTFETDDNDISTNYYTQIIKVLLYLRTDIDPTLNALADIEWDDEKGTVKINNKNSIPMAKDFYL